MVSSTCAHMEKPMIASNRLRIATIMIALITMGMQHRFVAHAQDAKQPANPATIKVAGAVEAPKEWTIDQIKTEFAADIKTVPYTLKGVKGGAQSVPLISIIKAAKLKVNPKQKNHELAYAVVVKGRDGYAACFSYGELL